MTRRAGGCFRKKSVYLYFFLSVAVMAGVGLFATDSQAYERYSGGCQTCHGAFTDSTSTKGTVFVGGNKHEMHRSSSYMATACGYCHTTGDGRDPYLGSSDGAGGVAGLGCAGCHKDRKSVV